MILYLGSKWKGEKVHVGQGWANPVLEVKI